MGKKSVGLLVVTLVVIGAVAGIKIYQSKNPKTEQVEITKKGQPVPPDIAKLNRIQDQIKKLSDEQIQAEVTTLRAKLKAENLVMRMNKNMLNDEEKERTKDMLVRLSLLGVERNKRLPKKADLKAEK
jgi:hypothetical protein